MGNDLLGGLGKLDGMLGGLVGGLAKSGLMPKDDPSVKLIAAQSEISDLQNQEMELLVEIGRKAFNENPGAWPQADKLTLIRTNLASATAALDALKQEQAAAQQAQEAAEAVGRCPSCGNVNPDGVKFCQDCGTKLGNSFCAACGAELAPGAVFCGECGAKQGE